MRLKVKSNFHIHIDNEIHNLYEFWNSIINERDHELIQDHIEAQIPIILNVEAWTLLLTDKRDRTLYRFYGDHKTRLQSEVIKFPHNAGLTGLWYASSELIFNQEGKQNRAYRSDVDNVISWDMKTSIIWPLLSSLSVEPVGILHLYNQSGDMNFVKILQINQLCKIMGNWIDNANQFSKWITTIVNCEEIINRINESGSNTLWLIPIDNDFENKLPHSYKVKEFFLTSASRKTRQVKQFNEVANSINKQSIILENVDKSLSLIKTKQKI